MTSPLPANEAIVTIPEADGDPRWRRNLLFTWLSQVCSLAGFSFGMPFVPYYIQDLGVAKEDPLFNVYWGLFTVGAPLALMIMGPVWGSLGDRHGRKLMMLRASMAATLVLFGMGYVGSVGGLIVFRLLQGFFTGTMPAAQALVATHAPDRKHGFALGTLLTAVLIGVMTGQFLGGRCADAYGYAESFKIGGCLLLLSTMLVLFGVQENFSPPEPEEESTGAVEKPARIGAALPILILTLGIVFVRRFDSPILPMFVQDLNDGQRQGSATIMGDLGAVCCLAGVLSGPLFGRLVDRFSPAILGKIALCGSAVAVTMLTGANSFAELYVWRFILVFFAIGLDPVCQVWISRATPTQNRGRIFGWLTSFRSLGGVLGPAAGLGTAALLGNRPVFAVVGGLLVALTPLVSSVASRMASQDPAPPSPAEEP